ncbi:hypothetical protein AAMO2058_001577100 [Amorphochlora amoebiformis]
MLLLLAVMAVADSRLQSPRHRQVLRRICRPSPHISRVSRHRDFMPSEKYDYSLPTNEVYRSPNESISGPFASSRRTLDYTYHSHYVKARRVLQDIIVLNFLKRGLAAREYTQEADQASTLNGNWIVFTAGAMGSGKGYTMRWLGDQGLFPIHSFVWVDADEIRTNLPEWEGYLETHICRCVQNPSRSLTLSLSSELTVTQRVRRITTVGVCVDVVCMYMCVIVCVCVDTDNATICPTGKCICRKQSLKWICKCVLVNGVCTCSYIFVYVCIQ